MKRIFCFAMLGVGALACIGCESGGPSREVLGQDYVKSVAALAEPADGPGATTVPRVPRVPRAPRRPMVLPIKLAVAQLGEVSPPVGVLDRLRLASVAFAIVQPIPSVTQDGGEQPSAKSMRRMARDLDADYLFVYGGTIDHAITGTPLGAANLTIIGAYIVPSEKIHAQAKVSGSLIDATPGAAGGVLLTISADDKGWTLSPLAARDSDDMTLTRKVRERAVAKLMDEFVAKVKAGNSIAQPTSR
jgi:hypothetical protein